MPRSLSACTITSEPGRMTARSRAPEATGRTLPVSRLICSADGGGAAVSTVAFCAASRSGIGTEEPSAAAPAAAVAAPFKNPRRFTAVLFGLVIGASPVITNRRVRMFVERQDYASTIADIKGSRRTVRSAKELAQEDFRAFGTDLEVRH